MVSDVFVFFLLAVTALASDPVSCLIKSCQGCRLNGLPKLKQFLKFEISEYENLNVEWVGGHTPIAYFKDTEGNTLDEVVLQNFGHDEMLDFFRLHGLEARKPKANYGEPTITWDYQGHHYEYFETKGGYQEATEFALSRTYNDLSGYPLTLTTKGEETALLQHLGLDGEQRDVWLGARDRVEEGLWTWNFGPEADTRFWQGKGTQGKPLDNQYHNWREHEPNNANDSTEEDCASIAISKQQTFWNDLPCHSRLALVVEYGDTPLEGVTGSLEGPSHADL